MDINLIQKIVNTLFPEHEIHVDELEILPRQQLNENNEWVEDSPAYFVTVIIKEYPSTLPNITNLVSLYTGLEFNFMRK